MTLDTSLEEAAILARLAKFAGGRIYDFIPDDEDLPRDANGDIRPYVTVNFGGQYPTPRDRSMAGEEEQPYVWVIGITAWGRTTNDTRPLGNAIRVDMIGWQPTENVTQLRGGGGGSFSDRDAAARPTRSARLVSLETTTNQARN